MSKIINGVTVEEFDVDSITKVWIPFEPNKIKEVFDKSKEKANIIEALPEEWKETDWYQHNTFELTGNEENDLKTLLIKSKFAPVINYEEWSSKYKGTVPSVTVNVSQSEPDHAKLSDKLKEKGFTRLIETSNYNVYGNGTVNKDTYDSFDVPVYDISDIKSFLESIFDVSLDGEVDPDYSELLGDDFNDGEPINTMPELLEIGINKFKEDENFEFGRLFVTSVNGLYFQSTLFRINFIKLINQGDGKFKNEMLVSIVPYDIGFSEVELKDITNLSAFTSINCENESGRGTSALVLAKFVTADEPFDNRQEFDPSLSSNIDVNAGDVMKIGPDMLVIKQ